MSFHRIKTQALVVAALIWLALIQNHAFADDTSFRDFLQSVWQDAQEMGISRATFDNAIHGLEPDFSLPDLVLPGREKQSERGQAEFVQPPANYLKESSFVRLAAQGKKLLDQHRLTLTRIEQEFGVPAALVLAIWGRETAFSNYKLSSDAVRVLATQAYVGRRKEFFRHELLMALRMLQDGTPRSLMRSSWAGAMGLTQFLPSEYYKYAVDFDGDGRANIWKSVPDALASAAKQLAGKGWQRGKSWAYEVRIPKGLDCTIANPDNTLPLLEWKKRGFLPARQREFDPGDLTEQASLLLPAGIHGPGFLILKNYYVIKDYNFSDLYVLFVGHLSERIAGSSAFETPWGRVEQLRSDELELMQRHLSALGLYNDKIDGKAGMRTRLALGLYQKINRLPLDCWPSELMLSHMQQRR